MYCSKEVLNSVHLEGWETLTKECITQRLDANLLVMFCDDAGTKVAEFTFAHMPGCCGIVVSTHTFIHHEYRNRGLGTALQKFKERLARDLGFSYMLATDCTDNEPQMWLFKKAGWKRFTCFDNRKTGNEVGIFGKEIKPRT